MRWILGFAYMGMAQLWNHCHLRIPHIFEERVCCTRKICSESNVFVARRVVSVLRLRHGKYRWIVVCNHSALDEYQSLPGWWWVCGWLFDGWLCLMLGTLFVVDRACGSWLLVRACYSISLELTRVPVRLDLIQCLWPPSLTWIILN